MKQGSPPKCMTQRKKRKRGGTDFSNSKAKRRREARRRLQQESRLRVTLTNEIELDEGQESLKNSGIDQIVECQGDSKASPKAPTSDRLKTMSDQQRSKRVGDRGSRGNKNVQSWLEKEFGVEHLQIAVEGYEEYDGCVLKEVRNTMDCHNVFTS